MCQEVQPNLECVNHVVFSYPVGGDLHTSWDDAHNVACSLVHGFVGVGGFTPTLYKPTESLKHLDVHLWEPEGLVNEITS